jgi:soluble lytic murein transglycosylase-like protein
MLPCPRASRRTSAPWHAAVQRGIAVIGLLAGMLPMGAPALAQVFVGQTESGSLLLSNQRSEDAPVLLLAGEAAAARVVPASDPPPAARPTARPTAVPLPRPPAQWWPLIRAAAREHGLTPALVAAVAAAESAFDAQALSPKGAGGVMQLMPATARRFGVRDRFSPEQSLRGGAAYLRWLIDHFGDDLTLALAAYNAGEGAVQRARGVPALAETEAYVPRVLAYLRQYEAALPREP